MLPPEQHLWATDMDCVLTVAVVVKKDIVMRYDDDRLDTNGVGIALHTTRTQYQHQFLTYIPLYVRCQSSRSRANVIFLRYNGKVITKGSSSGNHFELLRAPERQLLLHKDYELRDMVEPLADFLKQVSDEQRGNSKANPIRSPVELD